MRQLNVSIPIPNTVITQIGAAQQPIISGYTSTSAKFQNVVVQGNYAYVAASGGNSTGVLGLSLVIYDIQDPTNPVLMSYITTGTVVWTSGPSFLNGTYSIAVNGNYCYVFSSGSSKIYIVDVSNPAAPFNVSGLLITNSPGSLYSGVYAGGYCYIATQAKGLTVVNVTNPLVPVQTFQEGGTLNRSVGVYVSNGYCYTTNYQTTAPWTVRYLKIWSLSNPAAPTLLTTYTLPVGTKPGCVVVENNTAFVTDLNTNSVQIVDVTNPLAPNYLSSMAMSALVNVDQDVTPSNNVHLANNFVYITSGSNAPEGGAIDMYDITNLSAPIKITTYWSNIPTDLFNAGYLYNNVLYVADYGEAAIINSSYLRTFSTQTFISSIIDSRNIFNAALQIVAPVGAAGQYSIEASDDASNPTNWSDIPNTFGTVTGNGIYFISKTDISYEFLRVSYTNTGSGNLISNFKALGA